MVVCPPTSLVLRRPGVPASSSAKQHSQGPQEQQGIEVISPAGRARLTIFSSGSARPLCSGERGARTLLKEQTMRLRKWGLVWSLVAVVCSMTFSSLAQDSASVGAASASTVGDAVPGLVNYSGVLKDSTGKPVTGVTGVTFLLYKEEQGGSPLWIETQNITPDKSGHYTATLGSTKLDASLADSFASGEPRWLACADLRTNRASTRSSRGRTVRPESGGRANDRWSAGLRVRAGQRSKTASTSAAAAHHLHVRRLPLRRLRRRPPILLSPAKACWISSPCGIAPATSWIP